MTEREERARLTKLIMEAPFLWQGGPAFLVDYLLSHGVRCAAPSEQGIGEGEVPVMEPVAAEGVGSPDQRVASKPDETRSGSRHNPAASPASGTPHQEPSEEAVEKAKQLAVLAYQMLPLIVALKASNFGYPGERGGA